MLTSKKDKINNKLAGIYNIPRNSCDQNYIGKSKKSSKE